MLLKSVLACEQSLQRKVSEPTNVLKDELVRDRISLEELVEEGASEGVVLGHWSKHLDHLSQMVVSLTVRLSLPWVEQEVTGDQLEDHTGKAPQIRTSVVVNAEHHFRAAILPRLNLLSEVVVSPAAVAQIANFKLNILVDKWASLVHLIVLRLFASLGFFLLLFLLGLHFFEGEVLLNLCREVSFESVLPRTILPSLAGFKNFLSGLIVLVVEQAVVTATILVPILPCHVGDRVGSWELQGVISVFSRTLSLVIAGIFSLRIFLVARRVDNTAPHSLGSSILIGVGILCVDLLLELLLEFFLLLLAHACCVNIAEKSLGLALHFAEKSAVLKHILSLDVLVHGRNLAAIHNFCELGLRQTDDHILRFQIGVDNPAHSMKVVKADENLLSHATDKR